LAGRPGSGLPTPCARISSLVLFDVLGPGPHRLDRRPTLTQTLTLDHSVSFWGSPCFCVRNLRDQLAECTPHPGQSLTLGKSPRVAARDDDSVSSERKPAGVGRTRLSQQPLDAVA